ncbi:hypothetical protein AR687_23795 [Flavobacteriaceae bacterium CRH]|nr:hypothetical protein AR687_23795 [Flavobacteriaceae bacterium CRH]
MLLLVFVIFSSCDKEDPVPQPYSPGEQPTADLPDYPTKRQNSYPIVLVHGMGGWGRDEMKGYHYWGGIGDIQTYLTSQGYTTYTASMGPLSSNWDRAVELYYNIVGGTVDYGAVHAMRHGHNRYGESFPGFYPQWNASNKVHFIGHSMGGPTPRYLIQLLENGDEQEKAYVPGLHEGPTSALFKGGKTNWVASHTTVSGVHNGGVTVDLMDFQDNLKKLIYGMGAMGGIVLEKNAVYNFDLGQWGLQRQENETPEAYIDRVFDKTAADAGSSARFWQSEDNCGYDLSIKASQMQNYWVKSSPNVYYASYSFNDMEQESDGTWSVSENMNPLIKVHGVIIGKTTLDLPYGYAKWRPCDGLVSVPSSQYPVGHDYILTDTIHRKLAHKGVWDVHPVIQGQDHLSIVMADKKQSSTDWLNKFYLKIAKDLSYLPN